MHAATGVLETGALLIGGAFCVVALCVRFGLPTIAGYLVSGLAIGPSGLGLIAEGAALNVLGEIGVILLLFTLGLEFSLAKLIDLRRQIFGLGACQVLLTTAVVALPLASIFSVPLASCILVGGAVAMSSTALCLKSLANFGGLGTPAGRLAIAVLLFQDLAASRSSHRSRCGPRVLHSRRCVPVSYGSYRPDIRVAAGAGRASGDSRMDHLDRRR